MTTDDELASVRVEVDGGGISPEVPEVETESGGLPRWVLGLGLVMLLAVLGAVLVLRPSPGEAADGGERITPSTTTEPEGSPATTIPASDAPATNEPQEELDTVPEPLDPNAPVVDAVELNFENDVFTIIEADSGFLALESAFDATSPPLLRSDDGIDWIDVDTRIEGSIENNGSEPARSGFWFGLRRTEAGFAITQRSNLIDGDDPSTTFVSSDGVLWEEVESVVTLPGNPQFFGLIAERDDVAIYSEFLGDVSIAEVVAKHTDIDVGGELICDARILPTGGGGLSVNTCVGDPFTVTADNVVSDVPAAAVLACLDFLGQRALVSTATLRVDLASGDVVAFPGLETSFGFSQEAVGLADGLFASIDPGSSVLGSGEFVESLEADAVACDGVIELASTATSVIILNPETLAVTRHALPDVLDVVQFGFATQVLGELAFGDSDFSLLLVAIDTELWGLDIGTGLWRELVDAPPPRSDSPFTNFESSATGRRSFRVDTNLTIVDLEVNPSGLSVNQSVARVDTGTSDVLNDGTILLATDDVVFFEDFRAPNRGLWRLDVSRTEEE